MLNDYQGKFPSQFAILYLGLEPLCELHGDVHVGQTEGCVVQAIIVHCPTDFISEKKYLLKKKYKN